MTRRTHKLIASAITALTVTGLASALATADAAGHARTDGAPAAETMLAIPVQAPEGGEFRLLYAPGNGWRVLAASSSAQPVRKTAMSEAAAPTGPDTGAAENPLSVFVDGPTGYVFVWTADKPGWTFVGHVGEERH